MNAKWKTDRMSSIRTVLFSLICLVLILGACNEDGGGGKPEEPLHMVLSSWVGETPFHVGQQRNLYPKPIKVTNMSSASDQVRMFQDKDADAALLTMFTLIRQMDQGTDANVVAVLDYIENSDGIVARDDIASVADLKGKRIAVEIRTVSHFVLFSALQQAGLQESDVELINLSGQEGVNALQRGTVDAVTTWEPQLARAAQLEGMHTIFTSSDMPYPIMDVLVVHTDVIEQRPHDIEALLQGWDNARQLKQTNAPDFIANAQGMGITEEELQELIPSLQLITLQTNTEYFDTTNAELSLKTVYEDTATFMQEHDMLENPIRNYEEVFEPRFVQEYTLGTE